MARGKDVEEESVKGSNSLPPLVRSAADYDDGDLSASGIDLRKIWRGVRRKLWFVVACTVVATLVGIVSAQVISSSHQAEVLLLYRKDKAKTTLGGYSINRLSLPTIIQMIKLPIHFKAVKSILGLDLDPGAISGMINVEQPRQHSNLIRITCRASTGSLAVDVVNTLANVVVKHSQELHQRQLQVAAEYFRTQSEEVRQKLAEQIEKLAEFKKEYQYYELDPSQSPLLKSLGDIETKLQDASTTYNALLVEYENLKREIEKIPSHTVRMAYEESPLKERIAHTEMALLEARTRYAPQNPKIKMLEEELTGLRDLLTKSASDEAQSKVYEKNPLKESLTLELMHLQGKLRSAQKVKEDLTETRAQMEKQLETLPEEQALLTKLTHRKNALEEELAAVDRTLKSTEVMMSVGKGDVQLYQVADRAFPFKRRWVDLLPLLGMGAGFMFGLSMVVLSELMDRRFRTRRQVEMAYTIPCVSLLPMIPRLSKKTGEKATLYYIRSLVARLEYLRKEASFSSLAIVSSAEGEGKSMVSYYLARYFQRVKKKTIVIDFDPSGNPFFDDPDKTPEVLESYLRGKATLKSLITAGEPDRIMTAGDPDLRELIRGKEMAALMKELKAKYELVIIDGPSLVEEDYGIEVAESADRVLFVVGSSTTSRSFVDASLKELDVHGSRPFGIVLNQALPDYIEDIRVRAEWQKSYGTVWKRMGAK